MKKFMAKLTALSVFIISCIPCVAMADVQANISAIRINNLAENNIEGSVINNCEISNAIIKDYKIDINDINDCDSIIIPNEIKDVVIDDNSKTVYDAAEWKETVKVNIKIGEACINGDKGKQSFDTATYIQKESSSSMFPADSVVYLMGNLTISEIRPNITDDTFSINYDNKKIKFHAGSDKVIIDGVEHNIDNGAFSEIHNGKLFIPLRSLSNVTDCNIEWISDGKIVNIDKTFYRKSKTLKVVKNETTTETTTEATTETTIGNIDIPSLDNYFDCSCKCSIYCYCKIKNNIHLKDKKTNLITIYQLPKCTCEINGKCNCNNIIAAYKDSPRDILFPTEDEEKEIKIRSIVN